MLTIIRIWYRIVWPPSYLDYILERLAICTCNAWNFNFSLFTRLEQMMNTDCAKTLYFGLQTYLICLLHVLLGVNDMKNV